MVFLFGVSLFKHNVMNVCLCRVLITCQAESKMCILPPISNFFLSDTSTFIQFSTSNRYYSSTKKKGEI